MLGLDAYENSRDQSNIYNYNHQAIGTGIQNLQASQGPHRPPVNPKLKIKKPLKVQTTELGGGGIQTSPTINNYFKMGNRSTQNRDLNNNSQQSFIFSFGGNSPSVNLRNPVQTLDFSQSQGIQNMTPTQKNSMLKNGSNPSDIHFQQTSMISPQNLQDTIEFELKSQLDVAKTDLHNIQSKIQSKIREEVNKYPQFADEDSELNKNVKDLTSKFEIFENEILRRTKDLLRSYKVLKQENNSIQKRLSDCISMKEVEMKVDLVKSEYEEQVNRCNEDLNILQNQFKAQRFEIEGNIMKKLKAKQSEEEKKMEDFYKFKADVYQYLDSKYENLQNIYANKFKTIFEFTDRTDEKMRTLWDQKGKNDFKIDDFKTKQTQKIQIVEDQIRANDNKIVLVEAKIKDHQNYIIRIKKIVQQIQQDRNVHQRLEILEKKLSDEDIQNLIDLRIDLAISDKLVHHQQDIDSLIQNIENQVKGTISSINRVDKDISHKIENLEKIVNQNKQEDQKNLRQDFQAMLDSHKEKLHQLKKEFEGKQEEQEKSFVSSFNEIKAIVLQKVSEFDSRSLTANEKIQALEQSVHDVGQKYEHFQELFTNLIQEMQTTEEDEEGSVETQNQALSQENYNLPTNLSESIQLQKVVVDQSQESIEEMKIQDAEQIIQLKQSKRQPLRKEGKTLLEGEAFLRQCSKDQTNHSDRSIRKAQQQEKQLHQQSPSRNKQAFTYHNHINSSLPQFMKSHIQNQKNKIYVENSPERKAHDNMLISQKNKYRRDSVVFYNDEANVIDKAKSKQMMDNASFNEVWIAKQERMIKAYTPKFQENQAKVYEQAKLNRRIEIKQNKIIESIQFEDEVEDFQDYKPITGYLKSLLEDDEEDKSNEILYSSSSSYTYELVDQSINKGSPKRLNQNLIFKQHQQVKQGPVNQNKISDKILQNKTNQMRSFKSILSDDENGDFFVISDDDEEDEAIHPFEQSPKDDVVHDWGSSGNKNLISMIEPSSIIKTSPNVDRSGNQSQGQIQFQGFQRRTITKKDSSMKLNPLIDDEEASNKNSLTPLTSKLNFNDDTSTINLFEINESPNNYINTNQNPISVINNNIKMIEPQQIDIQKAQQNALKSRQQRKLNIQQSEEMHDIFLQICAKFIAEEIDIIFRNSIRRKN
ncbi:UNKNOWN [Stylonychia lemnae]|uniref:Uncharacterized protein n=1 Tax=Stylonychia lemnae TaxID=5949 RepID=A0A078AX45_STYLE|nr:UNKNOWN [Stylonychia lemnae]|eukprot:CDW85363.1 UNKNOWN [Stylonychia lemnae]